MAHTPDTRWRFLLPLAWVCLILAAPATPACNVPVFRYALERWKPSPYEVHVFHRGPLSPAQQKLLQKLEGAQAANLSLTTVDLAAAPPKQQATLWRLHGGGAALPCVLVQYPGDDEKAVPVWAGPLDETSLARLLESPKRRELVKLLTTGESAVWVLLESGDPKADEESAQLVRRELTRLEGALQLPVQGEADKLEAQLPLRLSFALLRVSRSDPAESAFVRLLLGSDEELEKAHGPIVFPVFGRGRLLFGLHGAQLKPAAIERWASFLCGPCSCQVKDLNPGVDLLLTAAWEDLLDTTVDPPEPARRQSIAPAIPPGRAPEPKAEETPAPHRGWLWAALGASGVVAAVAGARAWRGRGGSPVQGKGTPARAPGEP